jgi:2-polyprenyl-6-methoxyphenol hydroxylase-like FAD-dependent oxidoreductase
MHPDVLVVGAGPVGLTMAAELSRYGVKVRIVDKSASRTDKSKALVLWPRSLELMDRMGCTASFIKAGFKVTATNMISGDRHIAHISLAQLETPYPYALMLPQSDTERLMEQHLNSYGVQVERQVELTAFTPGVDKVTATLKHADGQQETIEASWMIGCDGAHSAVRHGLGMEFEGETLPSNWILADLHLAGVPSKPDELDIFFHAEGVLVLFPITPGRYRVIADVDSPVRTDPTLEQVQALLDRRGPGGMVASNPIWLAGFGINERKVAEYRAGRVFLAGDAAHIHSPAGGQGMNTGMQDAINLAWKLALVSRGLAGAEPLLGSYSTERSAVGREVLASAGRLTAIATLKGEMLQALRNRIASLVLGLSPARRVMTNQLAELSIGYPDSPLTARGHHRGGPAAGQRAPIMTSPVGAGDTPRFALFATPDIEATALIARYPALLEPATRPPFAEGSIWLVRPDGYVATVATQWADIGAYLDHVVGSPT